MSNLGWEKGEIFMWIHEFSGFPSDTVIKNPPASAGEVGSTPGSGMSPGGEKEMAIHSSILVWKIPWTKETGGLQSWGCKESDATEPLSMYA